MRRTAAWVLGGALCVALAGTPAAQPAGPWRGHRDPLAGFTPQRRAVIDTGAAVVDVLEANDEDFGVAGAARTTIDSSRLLTWMRAVEQLHGGRYVPLIARFSPTPRIEDLDTLVLDEEELEDLRDCRPGHCGLKMGAEEILQIQQAIRAGGAGWKPAAQRAFRQVVLARAVAYLAGGHARMPPYEDHSRPEDPAEQFAALMTKFQRHPLCPPPLAAYLRSFPHGDRDVESFLYWSKDLLGDVKPIVSITHMIILPATTEHPTIIAAVQVFATHYLMASLSLTALVEAPGDGAKYIVYSRWTRADVFDGAFGGLVRRMVNRRIRAEGPPVLQNLRKRLESGLPKPRPLTHTAR